MKTLSKNDIILSKSDIVALKEFEAQKKRGKLHSYESVKKKLGL